MMMILSFPTSWAGSRILESEELKERTEITYFLACEEHQILSLGGKGLLGNLESIT